MKTSCKILLLVTVLVPAYLLAEAQEKINPLSKIMITSSRATCQKDHVNPQQYIFNYQEDVLVTFADNSTITANSLEILFEGKSFSARSEVQNATNTSSNKFKKAVFSGNVVFTSQSRTAKAQRAELQLNERLCILTGGVVIQQKKTAPKEVPITIESDEARLNLATEELVLIGCINKPVNTVISLEDYEPLKKVKQPKKKK